jgi:RNA polymerase sigma factor (sigma-70 family)
MGLEAEMEVSALRYSGGTGLHGRSPLLRLQSDERLVTLIRRGNQNAFEVLVARYNSRLLAFCRHMLGSREDAEDVLQDVFTASYNALLADSRPINVRPWLYRIARNRCLNHLRRNKAVGVDSMDIHFSEHGATTADKVHEREEFRQLLDDIRDLPETQRTALVLREMDALSYEQIAEAMDTTVSSVKSLLVRARVSLTEAAEARLLTCDEAREQLAEVAEGLRRKQGTSVRRHVKNCTRCQVFQGEMHKSSRALAALAPIGPLAFITKFLFAHLLGHSAGSAGAAGAASATGAGTAGAGAAGAASAAGGAAAGGAAAAGAAGAGSAGLVTAGGVVGAVATKAAAGLAAAALVTAGTVAVSQSIHHHPHGPSAGTLVSRSVNSGLQSAIGGTSLGSPVGAGPGLTAAAPVLRATGGAAVQPRATHVELNPLAPTTTAMTPAQTTPTTSTPVTAAVVTPATSTAAVKPAATTLPAGTDTTVTTTSNGGVSPFAPTGTASTPTTTALTGTVTSPTTTAPTGTITDPTSTSPTSTSPTSTSPTTTTPAGTITAPTGTTTAPAGTTTAPAVTATVTSPTTTAPPAGATTVTAPAQTLP